MTDMKWVHKPQPQLKQGFQQMTHWFEKTQAADLVQSCDATCRGSVIAQEDVELVCVCVCGVLFHTACHAVYSDTAWLMWTSVLLIISPALPSLPHNYSCIARFSSTQPPAMPPLYVIGSGGPLLMAVFNPLQTSAHAHTKKKRGL